MSESDRDLSAASAENVAAVRAALDAFERQDMELLLSLLDPEIEAYSPPEMANPTHVVGRDKWLAWVADWLDAWESFEVEAEEFEPVGARHVVVKIWQRGRAREAGSRSSCGSTTCSSCVTAWPRATTFIRTAKRRYRLPGLERNPGKTNPRIDAAADARERAGAAGCSAIRRGLAACQPRGRASRSGCGRGGAGSYRPRVRSACAR
jgi:hypothetical protein